MPPKREIIDLCSPEEKKAGPKPEKSSPRVYLQAGDAAQVIPRRGMLHIQQKDSWSCGFRNLQMLLSALVPRLPEQHPYRRNREVDCIPSLATLQHALEDSWQEGFDAVGARHFAGQAVGRSWKIGAVEVASLLAFWSMDATVVQFAETAASRQLLMPYCRAYFGREWSIDSSVSLAQAVLDQATSSASSSDASTATRNPLPLYLQWQGHSVTIIGVSGSQLSVLDPASKKPKTLSLLARRDYQILVVTPSELPAWDRAQRKRVVSALRAR